MSVCARGGEIEYHTRIEKAAPRQSSPLLCSLAFVLSMVKDGNKEEGRRSNNSRGISPWVVLTRGKRSFSLLTFNKLATSLRGVMAPLDFLSIYLSGRQSSISTGRENN